MSSSFGIPPIGQAPSSDALSLPEPHSTHNKGVKRAHPPELEPPRPASKFRKLDNNEDTTPLPAAALASAAAAPTLSASSSSSSSSSHIDDDDWKESPDSTPFPFPVKALPSFESHPAEWLQKTGLTSVEFSPIESWVAEKIGDWMSLQEGPVLRFTKESTGLPRTVHVFKAFEKLCVQVLCKTKGGLPLVGKGTCKKGKVAVEWRTKTLWVQYVVKSKNYKKIESGLKVHDHLATQPGIFPKACGRSFYTRNSGAEKMNFFGPLRDGICDSALPLFRSQILPFAHQLLKILSVLEKANVVHYDIKEDNILYRIDSKQKVQIELSDFDLASIEEGYDLGAYRKKIKEGVLEEDDFVTDDLVQVSVIFMDLDSEKALFSEDFLQGLETQPAQQTLALFETQFAQQLSQTGS